MKRRHTDQTPSPPQKSQPKSVNQPSFPTHHDFPNLAATVRNICDVISYVPSSSIESVLSSPSMIHSIASLSSSDVETILKFSYASPASAVKFFSFSSSFVQHSPYAWNLVIDLLGKNALFSAMWDAIHSMHAKSLLSLATFASVFSSCTSAGNFSSGLKAFDEMEVTFGIKRDTTALNSLLSALCREGHTSVAFNHLKLIRHEVSPDGDSFAILMEGWENEGDFESARYTFDDMIKLLGKDPNNVPAYDSFLCCLLEGSTTDALMHLAYLHDHGCYPGMKFFQKAMDAFVRKDDAKGAATVWDILLGRNGCHPSERMFNSMIALQCDAKKPEIALKYFDDMVVYGAFPDETTYNLLLGSLLRVKKLMEAEVIFNEMVRNECTPTFFNCDMAVRKFTEDSAIKVWKCMVENGFPCEESGNKLVEELHVSKLPLACKFAEEMIDLKVKLTSANLSKLKSSLVKAGKGYIYDHLLQKWKCR